MMLDNQSLLVSGLHFRRYGMGLNPHSNVRSEPRKSDIIHGRSRSSKVAALEQIESATNSH